MRKVGGTSRPHVRLIPSKKSMVVSICERADLIETLSSSSVQHASHREWSRFAVCQMAIIVVDPTNFLLKAGTSFMTRSCMGMTIAKAGSTRKASDGRIGTTSLQDQCYLYLVSGQIKASSGITRPTPWRKQTRRLIMVLQSRCCVVNIPLLQHRPCDPDNPSNLL
jgi:hypothetical protein